MSFLQNLFANIFDIYPTDEFITSFVSNNTIDIDKILHHPLLKFSLTYAYIWNFVYKTYPTKKDFYEFLHHESFSYNNTPILDTTLLQLILNTFVPLKLGLIELIDIRKLITEFTSFVSCLDSNITEHLYEKWTYRYQVPVDTTTNIIVAYANLLKNFVEPVSNENITGYIDEFLNFTNDDAIYLNAYERTQYRLYRDNHFFVLHVNTSCIIVDIDMPSYLLTKLALLATTNKTSLVVILDIGVNIDYDPYYILHMDEEFYHVLPHIFTTFIYISDCQYPNIRSLSINTHKSIYYLYAHTFDDNIPKFALDKEYTKYIVTDLTVFKQIRVSIPVYVVLDFVSVPDDICLRGASNTIRLLVGDETFHANSTCFEGFEVTLVSNYDNNIFYDVVVDLYRQIDLRLVICGTVPISNKKINFIHHSVNGLYISKQQTVRDSIFSLTENIPVLRKMQNNAKLLNYVYSETTYDDFMRYHLTTEISNCILSYLNFVYVYFEKRLVEISDIRIHKKATNCVVCIDNRISSLSIFSILFSLSNLGVNWTCRLYTSEKSHPYYEKVLSRICDVVVYKMLDIHTFHIDIYNTLLKSESFWDTIEYEKCLIIQNDGILLRKGIDDFMDFDYVGAPWIDCETNTYIKQKINPQLVGNGGLSLRNVEAMRLICREHDDEKHTLFYNNICEIPEDVWITKYLVELNYKLPTHKRASYFSSEEILNMKSLGVHKLWAYQSPENVTMYLDGILTEK